MEIRWLSLIKKKENVQRSEGFCQSLIYDFALPNKNGIKMNQSNYLYMKTNILDELASTDKISICVDQWMKKGMTRSVIEVTAQFFNRTLNKKKQVLLGLRELNIRITLHSRVHKSA